MHVMHVMHFMSHEFQQGLSVAAMSDYHLKCAEAIKMINLAFNISATVQQMKNYLHTRMCDHTRYGNHTHTRTRSKTHGTESTHTRTRSKTCTYTCTHNTHTNTHKNTNERNEKRNFYLNRIKLTSQVQRSSTVFRWATDS